MMRETDCRALTACHLISKYEIQKSLLPLEYVL